MMSCGCHSLERLRLILILLILLAKSLVALDGPEIAEDFRAILSSDSDVSLPQNGTWPNGTSRRFNEWQRPTYVVAVKPALEKDVQELVKYANNYMLPFLATGGGHGYSGTLASLHNGIELDMRNFNAVTVDAERGLLTVGGGVRFSDLMPSVFAAGKAIPVGACPCVGMAGATLGGGIGFFSSMYGAISDSLLSVQMVIANGTSLTISTSTNSDLFWAIRGAGYNFGVVTSLTYKIHDAPNGGMAMSVDMTFPISTNGSIWAFARDWVGKQPKQLSMTWSILFDHQRLQLVLVGNIIYTGPLAEGRALIQPLSDLKPLNTNISYIPWSEVPYTANYGQPAKTCGQSVSVVPYSLNLYQIEVNALAAAVNHLNETIPRDPALYGFVFAFTQYAPDGFSNGAEAESVFPWRDVAMIAQMDGIASSPESIPSISSFGESFRNMLRQTSGRDELDVYTHFAHGDEGAHAWYGGGSLERLRSLKREYDPESIFSFYNPVEIKATE